MPLYSELYHNFIGNAPVIPSPILSPMPSSSYIAPSYVGVSRSYGNPITATRTPSFSRGYVPKLTPITETPRSRITGLTRLNSPKYLPCHASPTYQKPRRVINTADIDVSASRYAIRDITPIRDRYPSSSPTSSISPDPLTSSNISVREQELIERNEQRKARSAINRNRAVVRLNTMRARSKSRGSRGSTERKSPHRTDSTESSFQEDTLYRDTQPKTTSWRDQFRGELTLQSKKVESSKSPGELLLEKHLIRDDDETPLLIEDIVYKSPVMKRRATVRRKSTAKIPSFHEICSDISSDKLDDDLNAGELRRRASQIIEDEIAQFQQELHEANGIMNDQLEERLKSALEQQITESDVQFPEKKKIKKIKRARSKPLPKIDVDNNVVYDQPKSAITITADSPIIENMPTSKITAQVEAVEECAVFKLPKKKKKVSSDSSPESGESQPKKTQKKTDPVVVEQSNIVAPVRKVEVSVVGQVEPRVGDTTLGELAQRRKAQELQRKMDTLSKLGGKKAPVDTVLNLPARTAETDPAVEREIEQLEPPKQKKLEPPGKKVPGISAERKKTQDLEKKIEAIAKLGESMDLANIWDQCATATATATNVVKKLPTGANQEQRSTKLDMSEQLLEIPTKIPEKKVLKDLQKKGGASSNSNNKKVPEPQTKTKPDEKTEKNVKNERTISPPGTKLTKSLEKEIVIAKVQTGGIEKNEYPKDDKKETEIKLSAATEQQTSNVIAENISVSEIKAQGVSKSILKSSLAPVNVDNNLEKSDSKKTPDDTRLLPVAAPDHVKLESTKPKICTKSLLETNKVKDNISDGVVQKVVQTQEKPKVGSKLPEKITAPESSVFTSNALLEAQLESPKSVSPTSKAFEPPKIKQKQEEFLKPILKSSKNPPDIKVPSQEEEDFWGNLGTRETIAFARRKQNIERRNQLFLLKFSTMEEDSEEVPPPIDKPKDTAKSKSTPAKKLMASPAVSEAEQSVPPPMSKPKCDEITTVGRSRELETAKEIPNESVPKKAFVVTPVKLDESPESRREKQVPFKPPESSKIMKAGEEPKPIGQKKSTSDCNSLEESSTSPKEKQAPIQLADIKKSLTSVNDLQATSSNKLIADGKSLKVVTDDQNKTPSKHGEIDKIVVSKVSEHPEAQNLNTEDETVKEPPMSPKEKPVLPKIAALKKTLAVGGVSKEPSKILSKKSVEEDEMLKTVPQPKLATTDESPKPARKVFGFKKTPAEEESTKQLLPTKNLENPPKQPTPVVKDLLAPSILDNQQTPVHQSNTNLKPFTETDPTVSAETPKKLSPKEMVKAVAPTIAAAAEKRLAQAQKTSTESSTVLKQENTTDKPETPKKTGPKPQAAVEPSPKKAANGNEEDDPTTKKPSSGGGEKKVKIVKKVIRIVKTKGNAPPVLDAAAKAEADRLEAERKKQQENVEKMKAKVNQITLNMGVKLEVEIKECTKCQQAALTNALPVNKPQPASGDDKPAPGEEGGTLTKNKFGVVTNLSAVSAASAGNRSVGDQVATGADQQNKLLTQTGKARYSSSSSEVDKDTASETSFSGVEDDWSSDEEEEMANDKPDKKKFDPQKRVKLNVEQMRKCYSKEEKSPIVLVARPRPLWKVKRHGHRHNRHADLTSSSGSDDESESATDQTSSETASTVDASSDINTDSSVNSSRGNNKKKPPKFSSKTSEVGSDIYDNPMVIPLHSEPASRKSSGKDENNNERSQSGSQQNEDDDENNKNTGNHEIRSTSTSSHDSGFYGGGTAPISPKKAMETSYTYAQFQKTGKLTAPATVIPRFRKYNVDDFHFLTVLGKGSFGKVFLAELRNTEYYYAVKCLKKDVVLEDDDVDCTLIERKVLALGTKHPFLCHLFCTFQTDSHLFFVMEYLNGGDLMFHIQQSGRFTEPQARFYAAEIVSGLKFLHRKGIVYRDLKLDNVLLDYDGHVRIADFGMCKLEIYLDRLADSFCGTPDYMAPEIIKGQKYNQAVDWWSFGVLVYEMLVGQSPFSGCDEDELFWSICNEIPWFPHYLSKEALKLLKSLLEKDATIRLGCLNTLEEDSDVKYHSFFQSIDWQKLERRGLEPPFKPQVRHPLDTQYFDKQFTRERARLTPIDRNILASMNQAQFEGFTYTNPNNTLTSIEVTCHPLRCRSESHYRRFYV
ncbi:uncharacterized protein LOC131677710 isoform X2 [Topomyia yanbarensis]|uniref:uncharacterized protein LOC131677710 isoform X2 n=1 Tax=Topomyia yanbarensis TaxID=2498891 RepID=UPI00273ADB98|nr:uncharacterized protein LOC131677710 isoform X2 [Topomyia yanbarensis]